MIMIIYSKLLLNFYLWVEALVQYRRFQKHIKSSFSSHIFFFESVAGMNQTMVLIWLVESGMGRKAQASISAKITQKQQEFLILLGQDKYMADFAKF